jgi:hypothetical protein
MNYKEKAIEIIDRFYIEVKFYERAKQCALICVDEIMNLGLLYGDAPFGDGGKQFHSYWQQVKTEIEKL